MIIQRLLALILSTALVSTVAGILFEDLFALWLIAPCFLAGIVITWAVDRFWSRSGKLPKRRRTN